MASRHAGWVVLGAVIAVACAETTGGGTGEPLPDGGPQTDASTPAKDGGGADARSDARSDAGSGGEKIPTVPAGASDRCGVHGGDYGDDADAFECGATADAARNDQSPKLGIRCCSK